MRQGEGGGAEHGSNDTQGDRVGKWEEGSWSEVTMNPMWEYRAV